MPIAVYSVLNEKTPVYDLSSNKMMLELAAQLMNEKFTFGIAKLIIKINGVALQSITTKTKFIGKIGVINQIKC